MITYERYNIYNILNMDFNNQTNASYNDLLIYINELKNNYKTCVDNYNYLKNREDMYHRSLDEMNIKINTLQKNIEYFEKINKNLTFVLNRKLTIWERITGKIKY